MQYFVLWPDGQRFGPADENTLQLWAAERRIGPHTILVEAQSGRQFSAAQLPALSAVLASPTMHQPYAQQPFQQPPAGQPGQWYHRPNQPLPLHPAYAQKQSNTETILAWVFSAIGIFCCFLASCVGIVMAIIGISKRQPSAVGALILGILGLVVTFFLRFLIAF